MVTAEFANQVSIELEPGDNGAQALEGVSVEYSEVVTGVAGRTLEPVGVTGQARVVAGFAVLLGCRDVLEVEPAVACAAEAGRRAVLAVRDVVAAGNACQAVRVHNVFCRIAHTGCPRKCPVGIAGCALIVLISVALQALIVAPLLAVSLRCRNCIVVGVVSEAGLAVGGVEAGGASLVGEGAGLAEASGCVRHEEVGLALGALAVAALRTVEVLEGADVAGVALCNIIPDLAFDAPAHTVSAVPLSSAASRDVVLHAGVGVPDVAAHAAQAVAR